MPPISVVVLSFIMSIMTVLPPHCDAHGRLMDPPARNSMWRLGFNNPVNYNDNELYCGGRMVQWLRNSGKCGVCGDPFHGKNDHEAGGKYANGIITRSFHEGDVIPVTVHLTANHLGWFEFRVCPVNDPKKKVTQKCLDKYQLERADGKGTKYFVPKGKYNAFFNYTLQLPKGLTCKQCVIQWKYRTGNTWDKDDKSGLFCLGCGPQEEFYNCADIEILPKGQKSKWTKEQNMRPTTTTEAPGTEKKVVKPVKIVVNTKHDKDKNNYIDKYDHKTTLPATASKPSSPKAVTKRLPKNHPKQNSIISHPTAKQKEKPKHPQDVKYNWRASTPWLLRRKYLNRRRLGLKHKQRRIPENNIDKEDSKQQPDPKVQNEPNAKKTPATKTTTPAPTTKQPAYRKPIKHTSPQVVKTTAQQYRTSPKPQRVTKIRTTVTKPPKTHIIRGPSKSWLITSRKRQQNLERKSTRPVKQTTRPVKHTTRPVKQTTRPVKQTTRPVKQTTRPVMQRTPRPGRRLPKPVVQKVRPESADLVRTTTHNCVTETPETKPLKQTILKTTSTTKQNDIQTQNQHTKFVTPKQQYSQRPTKPAQERFSKQPTTSHAKQRVLSYQSTVPEQPVQQHRQQVVDTRQPMVDHGQPMIDHRQQIVDRGQPMMDHREPMMEHGQHMVDQGQMLPPNPQSQGRYGQRNPALWWNQYQRPVNYFWNRPAVTPILKCRATITLGGGMDEWCTANCNANFCPGGMCICHPDHQPSYPSYSMYPPQTQGWGNTYSPTLNQFNTEPHVPSPSQSLSPFAPRRQTVSRPRTVRKLSPVHQVRRQKQYRPARQQIPASPPVQNSRSIFERPTHSPSNTSPRRDTNSVWAQKGKYYCRATGRYAGLKRFDEWCSKNCMNVICPLLICECNTL